MKLRYSKKQSGFTLMEVLIALSIVAALAALAIPSYIMYSNRSAFSELVQTAERYRPAVATCITQFNGDPSSCNGGTHGILDNTTVAVGSVASVEVSAGVIIVTPTTGTFESSDTYILTPVFNNTGITWIASGGGCAKGYAHCE